MSLFRIVVVMVLDPGMDVALAPVPVIVVMTPAALMITAAVVMILPLMMVLMAVTVAKSARLGAHAQCQQNREYGA